jgi:hypothetical protein
MIKESYLIKRRRAVGPVIVSVFMISVLLLGYSIFQLIFFRTNEFSETIETSQQHTLEKRREELTVLGNPFSNNNTLNLTLVNVGEVETEIMWITVLNSTNNSPIYGYKKIVPPVTLRPEQTSQPLVGKEGWNFSGGNSGNTKYIIQAVTERGTKMNYIYANPEREPIKGETEHLVIGPFVFDFTSESFTYTSESKNVSQPGYEIRDDEKEITFLVEITNHHNVSMEINAFSYMLLVIPEQPTDSFHESEVEFYIVGENSTYDSLDSYDPINPLEVEPDQTTILKFAATEPKGSNFHPTDPPYTTGILQGYYNHDNPPGTENLVTTFLVLFWKYGETGEVLGQTIPFVSIYLPDYM